MTRTATAREINAELERTARLVVYPPDWPAFVRQLGSGALDVGRDPANGLKLDDPRASTGHARIHPGRGGKTLAVRDQGSTNGTFVDGERTTRAELHDNAVLRFGDTLVVLERGGFEHNGSPDWSRASFHLDRQRERASAVASPVLFLGPTGAGKGHLAERVAQGSRWPKPFVHVNCAGLPATLVESELFGHVRGAFTGADGNKRGLIESAAGGTIFLDEIGAVSTQFQAKLLTTIESGSVRPIGATSPRPVQVRYLAATNLDVEAAIEAGTFREDLFFRLAAITIDLPPLISRRADIVPLLTSVLGGDHRVLTAEALEALLVWPWPGNVRELLNLVANLSSDGSHPIDYTALPAAMTAFLSARSRSVPRPRKSRTAPPREVLESELERAGGNISELARRLGKHRNQVVRWLDAYHLR